MLLIFRFIITLIVVMVSWQYIPGIVIHDIGEAFLFAVILSLLNASVRPILIMLTLPISILTLGLFTLAINVFTFWLASILSYGVHIETFLGAFLGGLLIWITGILTNRYIWRVNLH
jgi:putative membrane protein